MIQKRELGFYIHIPFCARKCQYCDFVSGVASRGEINYYKMILLREIRSYESLANVYQIRTIFFGGGTPSLMEPEYLKEILDSIRARFILAEDVEITVECNPGTLTLEKLKVYREMGVNRLSLGLQSAHDDELALLGRIHTWKDFLDSYHLARRMGFKNINIDLMSALPRQSLDSWKDTLQKVVALYPEHISAYSLIIEEGTPFYETYSTYPGSALLPGERTEREMYHWTQRYLEEKGYHRYEISNYAKEGYECRHNITYWTGGDYIGVGLGASSYLQNCRYSNPAKYNEYWEEGKMAYSRFRQLEPQSKKATVEEFMFLGLRMMRGVSTEEFRSRFGLEFRDIYGSVLDRMVDMGLMEQDGEWVRLTEYGIDVSNRVMAEFLLDEEL